MEKLTKDVIGNLAIIGSRTFNNYHYAKAEIMKIITSNFIVIDKIISGGATGADKIAETFAKNHNLPIDVITPDWKKANGLAWLVILK